MESLSKEVGDTGTITNRFGRTGLPGARSVFGGKVFPGLRETFGFDPDETNGRIAGAGNFEIGIP